jgi:hypothetical protein
MNAENYRRIAALEANVERYGRLAVSNPQFRVKQNNVLKEIEKLYRNARTRNLAPIRRGSVQSLVETLTPTPSPKANDNSMDGGLWRKRTVRKTRRRKTQRKRTQRRRS